MHFDERSTKLPIFVAGSGERQGVECSICIDELAASVVGEKRGGSRAGKGVVKERRPQIVSVITQVAILRRVSRFKVQR